MLDIASSILGFFQEFIDMLKTAVIALQTFNDFLIDFDNRIIAMVDNCGSSEFTGFPINKAIAIQIVVNGNATLVAALPNIPTPLPINI